MFLFRIYKPGHSMEYPSEQKTIHLHESFLSSTIPLAREVIMIVIILILIFFLLFFLLIGIGLARKRKPWPKSHPIYWSKLLLTVLALCFVFSMITQPKTVFDGAVSGPVSYTHLTASCSQQMTSH